MMTIIKQAALKYWFYTSALALAVLYYLVDSRGKKIQELNEDVQRLKLGQELQAIQEKSKRSQEDFENAKASYDDLKSIHGDLLTRLGISHSKPGSDSPKPNAGA